MRGNCLVHGGVVSDKLRFIKKPFVCRSSAGASLATFVIAASLFTALLGRVTWCLLPAGNGIPALPHLLPWAASDRICGWLDNSTSQTATHVT